MLPATCLESLMVLPRALVVLLLVLGVGLGCSEDSSSPGAPSPLSGSPSGLAPALPGSSTSSGPVSVSGLRSPAGSPVDVASSRRQAGDSSDRAPGAVSNLRQLPATGVVFAWDRPAANDYTSLFPVTQYSVERDGVRVATLMAERDCTATTGCIYRDPGLAAGSYTFRVWAENPEPGPASEITVTVAVTPPAAVRNLAGEQVFGEASVRLTWAPPLAGTDVDPSVAEYEVVTMDSYDSITLSAPECSGRGAAATCSTVWSRLPYPATHGFAVAALNSAGKGPREYVQVRVEDPGTDDPGTSDRAPGPVRNLRRLTGSGVVLRWDRPAADEWTSLFPVTQYGVERDGTRVATLLADRDCRENEGCTYRSAALEDGSYTFLVWAENPEAGPGSTVTVVVAPPFTASFSGGPASHNGRSRFNVTLTFSEEFSVSYRTLQNRSLQVDGGRIVRVSRRVRNSNLKWRVRIRPSGRHAVTIVLPGDRPCDARGALCTRDGRRLSGTAIHTVSAR